MSYDQTIELPLRTSDGAHNFLTSATGEKCRWTPMYTNHIVRALSITPITTSSITVKAKYSLRLVTAGAHKASVSGDEKTTLTMVTGENPGKIRTRDKLDIDVPVGQSIVLSVITAVTDAYKSRASLLVQPKWDTLANATGLMTAATS